jgi:hypothetical protein
MTGLPIACSLDSAELAARRQALLPGLVARAAACELLSSGARWRFTPSGELLQAVAATIEAERACCRFLRFEVTVEPDRGPVWLEVTGPGGTREFLEALLDL